MTFGARVAETVARIRFRGVVPLVLMGTLILAVGAFTSLRQDAFLTNYNLRNLLLATMPLALVSMGQTCALLVGGFDVSVAALMTLCVVVAWHAAQHVALALIFDVRFIAWRFFMFLPLAFM